MKKAVITILIVVNIFVLFGLLGLVGYQFTQLISRNNEISQLTKQLNELKDAKKSVTNNIQKPTSTDTSSQNTTQSQKENTDKSPRKITLYFSNKESASDFTATGSAIRETDRIDVALFALEELIKGPTADETAKNGLTSPIVLTGVSNCGAKDAKIALVGTTATVTFCKAITTNGVGDDARVKTAIEKTLTQFDSIKKVVILNNNASCFGDQSGQDQCKK
jgi:spore germination protein GerM